MSTCKEEVETEREAEGEQRITWSMLDIGDLLLQGIYNKGFEFPSPIQYKAVKCIATKQDLIAQSQSGTGKTAAFCISMLQTIQDQPETQGIILVPTHELADQAYNTLTSIGCFLDWFRVQTLVGGRHSVQEDVNQLRSNPPHVVVGCIGRILDMINRKALNLSKLKLCVFDEADQLLSAGFIEDMKRLISQFHEKVQIALFSATMPPEIIQITKRFMDNPQTIVLEAHQMNLEGIAQYYIHVRGDFAKKDTLKDIFDRLPSTQTMIYANSIHRVKDIEAFLKDNDYSVITFHSDMPKYERERNMEAFRNGTYRVMISSDLTARGVDVQQVSTVINFDMPPTAETYLHRIGRSGRFGRKGNAINFVNDRDMRCIEDLNTYFKITVRPLPKDFVL
jgi:superfamily II DNA/RNA helicase